MSDPQDRYDQVRGKEEKVFPIGKGGGKYAATVPELFGKEWEGRVIETFQVGGALLLVPSESWRPKVGELDFQENDPDSLEYQIITAYLNNYRRVYLTFKDVNKECIDRLERLPEKLLGLSPTLRGALNRREIKMSTEVEPISRFLDDMHSNVKSIHEINQAIFTKLEPSKDVEVAAVETLENDIDKKSFLVKRLFCIVLCRLHLAKCAGIDDLSQIIHYENLNSNLERAGDLQLHVFKELNRLTKAFGKGKLKKMMQSENPAYSFQEYHEAAQKMLDDAYSNDPGKIDEIIKTKRQDSGPEASRGRGKYITKEQMKAITDLTTTNSDLRCLDFRIWGVTGSATNVAEAWLNMRGPSLRSKGEAGEVGHSPTSPNRGSEEPLRKKE